MSPRPRTCRPSSTGPQRTADAPRSDADPGRASRRAQHVVILSGLSGGGKTAAAKLFEDLGYTVGRQPARRAPARAGRARLGGPRAVREGRDRARRARRRRDRWPSRRCAARSRDAGSGRRCSSSRPATRSSSGASRETRHRHPLADTRGIASSIAEERRLLKPIRDEADVVLDTSDLSLRELRERLFAHLGRSPEPDQLAIQLISFGFKYGVPLEADLVFDVRFMQNPYYIAELRASSGLTEAVRAVRPGPADREAVPRVPARLPGVRHPGLRGGGQDPADHRHRLHRRLPPLDRDRRGGRRLAPRCRTSGRSPCSTASSSGAEPVVDLRSRLVSGVSELRRWLTPGSGSSAGWRSSSWASSGWRSGWPSSCARSTATSGWASRSSRSCRRVTLQFLPYWLRAVILASLGVAVFGFARLAGRAGPDRAVSLRRRGPAAGRGHLPEAVPGARAAGGGASAAGPACRPCCAGSRSTPATSPRSSPWPTTAARRASCASSSVCPPVGDIRNCIVALADAEPLMGRLLQYRFPEDQVPESLGGHAVGNLLIAAMTAVEGGDFEEGVRQMNRVLAVRGQVVPASPTPLVLHAALGDGAEVVGQSRIAATSGIERVWLTPVGVDASTDAVTAIAEADILVIGPGSLFTSVLPALLLPEIRGGGPGVVGPADLRLQRRHPGRRDERVRPGRSRRGARAPRLERDRRHRPGQQPDRLAGQPRRGGGGRPRRDPAALAAQRRASAAAGPRRPGRSRGSPPPRPGPPGRGDHPHRRAGWLGPAARCRRSDRVTGAPGPSRERGRRSTEPVR